MDKFYWKRQEGSKRLTDSRLIDEERDGEEQRSPIIFLNNIGLKTNCQRRKHYYDYFGCRISKQGKKTKKRK